MSLERTNEGKAERQEDLRQVQGDPPPRAGHGDLRQPPAQAAPGLKAPEASKPDLTHRVRTSKQHPTPVRSLRSDWDDTPGTEAGDLPSAGPMLCQTSAMSEPGARHDGTPCRRRPSPRQAA